MGTGPTKRVSSASETSTVKSKRNKKDIELLSQSDSNFSYAREPHQTENPTKRSQSPVILIQPNVRRIQSYEKSKTPPNTNTYERNHFHFGNSTSDTKDQKKQRPFQNAIYMSRFQQDDIIESIEL
jgi:hypothetical protein